MANQNNKIDELVTNDDDPTSELETLSSSQVALRLEANEKTHSDDETGANPQLNDVSVSELELDLRSHKKIIDQLQYDIEQLNAKRRGLEAEVGARDSQTIQINKELAASHQTIAQREELIKKRDRKIVTLNTEIVQRDESYRLLRKRLDELRLAASDTTPVVREIEYTKEDLASRLQRLEEYADSIRRQSLDLIEKNAEAEREISSYSSRLADGAERYDEVTNQLSTTRSDLQELKSSVDQTQKQHEEEIRTLRFELGDAQSTIAQNGQMNSQMVSDLVEAQSINDELERTLGETKAESIAKINKLKMEAAQLSRKADDFEQKLTARGEAISVLLAELAAKSEEDDSSGEIGEFVQDVDDSVSEQRPGVDNVSRVLVGTVEDKMLRFPLFKSRLTIGRTDDNDIQINAVYVSRRHAVIQTDDDVTTIYDWGSKNGIQVNSDAVSEHVLCHGDAILIGNARFRYEEHKKRDSQ